MSCQEKKHALANQSTVSANCCQEKTSTWLGNQTQAANSSGRTRHCWHFQVMRLAWADRHLKVRKSIWMGTSGCYMWKIRLDHGPGSEPQNIVKKGQTHLAWFEYLFVCEWSKRLWSLRWRVRFIWICLCPLGEMEGGVQVEVQTAYLDSALEVGDVCDMSDILPKVGGEFCHPWSPCPNKTKATVARSCPWALKLSKKIRLTMQILQLDWHGVCAQHLTDMKSKPVKPTWSLGQSARVLRHIFKLNISFAKAKTALLFALCER